MSEKRTGVENIPGDAEWAGYREGIDARYLDYALCAHDYWFGKSLDAMQQEFSDGRSVMRGNELVFMPRRVFQFYVFAFAKYVMSDAAVGDPDAASCFLNYLIARETRDPGSVSQVYALLEPTITFVAASQARFDASREIYGDFADMAAELAALCGATHSPRDPEDQMLDPTDDA